MHKSPDPGPRFSKTAKAAIGAIVGLGVFVVCAYSLNQVSSAPLSAPQRPRPTLEERAAGEDIDARRELAHCYGEFLGCPSQSVQRDPVKACVWRTVILASQSPDVSLADTDAYESDCGLLDETSAQKGAAAVQEAVHTAYNRDVTLPLSPVYSSTDHHTLYSSAEGLRLAVNDALALMKSRSPLPSYGRPTKEHSPDGDELRWKTCAADICLQAISPVYGGGVRLFRVEVQGGRQEASVAAASLLATSAIGQPSLAPRLAALPVFVGRGDYTRIGTACWGVARTASGAYIAGALAPPCPR
jgi:hypothetical protein